MKTAAGIRQKMGKSENGVRHPSKKDKMETAVGIRQKVRKNEKRPQASVNKNEKVKTAAGIRQKTKDENGRRHP